MTHYWVLSESTHVDQWGSLAGGGDGEPQKATVMMMIGNVGGGGEGF